MLLISYFALGVLLVTSCIDYFTQSSHAPEFLSSTFTDEEIENQELKVFLQLTTTKHWQQCLSS